MKKTALITSLLMWFFINAAAQPHPEMIKVEGGTFTMGSNSGDDDEKLAHRVTVSSFSIGKYEVTVAEYKAFCTAAGRRMPVAPSWGWNDKHPMVNLSFNDAISYCNWLSKKTI